MYILDPWEIGLGKSDARIPHKAFHDAGNES